MKKLTKMQPDFAKTPLQKLEWTSSGSGQEGVTLQNLLFNYLLLSIVGKEKSGAAASPRRVVYHPRTFLKIRMSPIVQATA